MVYYGIFFEGPARVVILQSAGEPLQNIIPDMHVTYYFRPPPDKELPEDLVGKPATVQLVGVGNDGQNHGVLVKLPQDTISLYNGAAQPHVTVSLAPGAKAVNTAHLDFKPIQPVSVTGKYGYFDKGQVIIS